MEITRRYSFTQRDVYEALVAWLKSQDIQQPIYVGDAETTRWFWNADGIKVEWTEELKD